MKVPSRQRFFTGFFSVFCGPRHWEALGLLVMLKLLGGLAGGYAAWWFVLLPLLFKLTDAAAAGLRAPPEPAPRRPSLYYNDVKYDDPNNHD